METTTYTAGQAILVNDERAIVIEQSGSHGWVNCSFPDRDRFADGGWVDPKDIRPVSADD